MESIWAISELPITCLVLRVRVLRTFCKLWEVWTLHSQRNSTTKCCKLWTFHGRIWVSISSMPRYLSRMRWLQEVESTFIVGPVFRGARPVLPLTWCMNMVWVWAQPSTWFGRAAASSIRTPASENSCRISKRRWRPWKATIRLPLCQQWPASLNKGRTRATTNILARLTDKRSPTIMVRQIFMCKVTTQRVATKDSRQGELVLTDSMKDPNHTAIREWVGDRRAETYIRQWG